MAKRKTQSVAQLHSPGLLFLLSVQVNPEDQENLLHPESKTQVCEIQEEASIMASVNKYN